MVSSRYAAAPTVDFLAAYTSVAAEVVEAVLRSNPGAPVPACPSWSTYDLVVHLGNVHAWAATILETGRSAPAQDDRPGSRRPRAVADWYAGKAGDLLQVLRAARPDEECWTFSRQHRTQAFWLRRQTHETWVHLVDLRQARGHSPAWGTAELPGRLAADGIDEVLEVFLPRMHARGDRADLVAPVMLRTSDTGDSWLLTPRADGPPAVRRLSDRSASAGPDGRPMDVVTGPAADLMMLLWKRLPPQSPGVTLSGDRGRLLALLGSSLTA